MKIIIPYYQIMKRVKISVLFIISTTSLHAHSGNPDMIWGFLFMGSLLLLLISLLLRLFMKSNTLIYISLFFMVFFFLIPSIKSIKKDFKINAWHMFDTPNNYGVYEGNKTIVGTENLNIIYMTHPSNNIPDILDDNKTIYLSHGDRYKYRIYVKELNRVSFFDRYAGNIHIFAHRKENNDSMFSYSPVGEKKGEYSYEVTNYAYDEENTNYHLYRFNRFSGEYEDAIKSYENVAFNNTRKLNDEFIQHEPIVLLDKENKQLRLYERRNGERFRPFSVPYTPRMAVYERNKDRIFVVYEEVRGVYILENAKTKEYTDIQNRVKILIDTSVKSPKKLVQSKIHSLNKEQLAQLHEILIKKPDIRYEYKVDVLYNEASVYISSESYPSLHVTFILSKVEQWIIKDILYVDLKRLKVLGG